METLPNYISIVFVSITILTIALFYLATAKNNTILVLVLLLAAAQAVLAYNGFFLETTTKPPRLVFILSPSIILMLLAFFTPSGKKFINSINLKTYTYLHSIRIVVEFVILWLSLHLLMPESMTFEGRNFDILSGITAPIVALLAYSKKPRMGRKTLLAWNIICLLLVLQVVTTGLFAAPSVIQQIEFDRPNVGILYFPFIWLPGIVVPIVIFGHIVAISRWRKALT